MTTRLVCCRLAAVLATPGPGLAQSLAPGDRIRVLRPAPEHIRVGSFVRATADSLWLRPSGGAEVLGIALGLGFRLERSLGRHSKLATGALIGAGAGPVATVLFLEGFCGGDTRCDGDEQLRAIALIGLPSVALGAGVGLLIRVERWAPAAPSAPGDPRARDPAQPALAQSLAQRGAQ